MSEILTKPSTTKESQEITQSGTMSIPDINFSINLDVNVNIDPEIKALLTSIFGRIEAHKQAVCAAGSTDEPVEELETVPDIEPIETNLSSPEVATEPEKYGHIVYGDVDSWNRVLKYKNLRWKVEGRNLLLRYWSGNVTTTWENMERLARLPETLRNKEINTLSNSCNYKTAMRLFARCLNEGLIKKPTDPDAELEEAFAKFVEEVDSDTVSMEV